ncbi:MAG: sigma-70 family RNA polymerase sigma factor, partial [Kofleriaceae bacterium]
MTDLDPDADVLALVDRGDTRAASCCLQQRHGRAVYRFCREALQDAALADDVHQQVFIAALRDLATFRRRSTVRTWLFAIARNRVLDAIKARRRAHAWIDATDAADVPDRRPTADAELDDAELRAALLVCLRA